MISFEDLKNLLGLKLCVDCKSKARCSAILVKNGATSLAALNNFPKFYSHVESRLNIYGHVIFWIKSSSDLRCKAVGNLCPEVFNVKNKYSKYKLELLCQSSKVSNMQLVNDSLTNPAVVQMIFDYFKYTVNITT